MKLALAVLFAAAASSASASPGLHHLAHGVHPAIYEMRPTVHEVHPAIYEPHPVVHGRHPGHHVVRGIDHIVENHRQRAEWERLNAAASIDDEAVRHQHSILSLLERSHDELKWAHDPDLVHAHIQAIDAQKWALERLRQAANMALQARNH